jgi:branched-chain amino acid transport system substrate-binding protein
MVNKIFYFLLMFIGILYAQNSQENFNQAVFLFNNGEYEPAAKMFEDLAKDESFAYSIPAEIFLGKIYNEQGRLIEAEGIFSRLKQNIMENYYRNEILLANSVVMYNKGMYYESARDLLELISDASGTQYSLYAENALDTLAQHHLSSEELETLLNQSSAELKPLMLLLTGKGYLSENNSKEAKKSFQHLIKEHPSSVLRKEAEDYLFERKIVQLRKKGDPVIVVLFPEAEGTLGRAVNQIREGIKYALHEFNYGRDNKVGLVFLDMVSANVKRIRESILSLDSKCIIGPIYSDDVRLVLSEFRGIKLPIISPTATDNGLTQLNDFFFQANPNFTMRGKAMAQYIYYVENKRKMGVLNAIESYSPLLANEFIREFRKLGGEIVINRTYKSRSESVNEAVEGILHEIGNIEGLYLPVSDKDDIPLLLNALGKNEISVPLYGNQDWFLGKAYETYPLLKNNLIFTSDYFIDYSSYSYRQFNEEFIKTTGIDADRNVLYGYDLAKYFLTQVTKVHADPDVIASRMMNGNTVNGYHNNISFDEERVNRYINIIRFNGLFELVDKFKASN